MRMEKWEETSQPVATRGPLGGESNQVMKDKTKDRCALITVRLFAVMILGECRHPSNPYECIKR